MTGVLEDLGPDETALWDWVRARLDAAAVADLAALDYGMHVDRYRDAVEDLAGSRRMPQEPQWESGAVLEPASLRKPGDPGDEDGRRGHVARLFACTVLTRSGSNLLPAAVLAGLVGSALALGPEATERALRHVAWLRLHEPGEWRGQDDDQRAFLTLGVLLLCVAAGVPGQHDATGALTAMFVREARGSLRKAVGADGWRAWRALVDRHLPDAPDVRLRFGLPDPD